MSNCSWELRGDILAYYIHFYKFNHLFLHKYRDFAHQLGTTEASLKARVQNVKNIINPNFGLKNPAKQTIEVVIFLEAMRINSKSEVLFETVLANFINRILL